MMKDHPRRLLIFSMFFIFLFVPVSNSAAADLDLPKRSVLGARQTHVGYSEEKMTVNGIDFETEAYNSTMTEVNYAYFFTDYFSVEFGIGYVNADVDLNALDFSDDTGELKQLPILLSGRFSLPLADIVVPYIGGGPGFFFNDFDQTGVDVDNSIGYFVGGGVDIFLSRKIALNIDAKYMWNRIKAHFAEDYSKEFDLNMVIIGGGFKYYF